ncbi:MAG: GDP-mannose 4,6-dehydratase [Chloroflexi bacterium]|nr:GDP-mannose 4,6-dehydratase [Chloroflexota bacterium]
MDDSHSQSEEPRLRALITGINGFAGSHLADFLLTQRDLQVFGGVYGDCDNIVHLEGRATFIAGDLRDPHFADSLIEQVRPDRIFHLAGQAFPPASWQDPWATLEVNLRAQVNLFESIARSDSRPRVLVIGSMEEYGRVDENSLPLTEETPFHPDSPYGVSKVAQDLLGLQYFLSRHLPVVRVRPSNHIGPRQSDQFVTSNFARQIAEIEAGRRQPVIRVGNLSAARDFTDVRDMMRAYWLALDRGIPGEVYNIGSGHARPIREVLERMLVESSVPIQIEQDPARLRPSDTPVLYCSAAKLQAQTGWQPTIPLETSLRDILDYWRAKIQLRKEE